MKGARIKALLYAIIFTALFGILGYMYYFLYSTIEKESSGFLEASTKIVALERKERDFTDAVKDLAELESNLKIIKGSFVSENSFVKFLESLEELGRQAGASFEAVSANFEVAESEPAILRFRLAGDFESVIRFFILFDKIPQAGILQEVSMTSDQGVVQAQATFLIFNREL